MSDVISVRQEINLLQNQSKSQSPKVSFTAASVASILFMAVLMGVVWGEKSKLEVINQDIISIEKSNMFQQSNTIPTGDIGKYQSQLKALEKQLLNKYQLWANYQQITSTGKEGFSKHFYHIANLSHTNLSLYEIDIYNKGKNLSLKGYARKAEYIPIYINELKKQKEFENVVFGDLSIEKLADHPVMRFTLERIKKEQEKVDEHIEHDIDVSKLMSMPLASQVEVHNILSSDNNQPYRIGQH